MVYRLFYTDSAQKDLAQIENLWAKKVLKKMDFFISLADPFTRAKQLTGFEIPTYRFRIGDYRVVFRKDVKTNKLVVLVVLKIAHRKNVYSHSV